MNRAMEQMEKDPAAPLLAIDGLSVHFPVRGGLPFARKKVEALTDVSLTVNRGDTFGIVGESGCGKSTLANAILGLVEPQSGSIRFMGRDLLAMNRRDFRRARLDMQLIFQDPFSSLNPRFNVYQIISEPMRIKGGFTREEMEKRVVELLHQVGLSERDLCRYPSDFSGGQKQRIGIARAISLGPELLLCDEPVSALDVSVHAQILNLLAELQGKLGMTYLFISHNLATVRNFCNAMAVMYLGNVMERGDARAIFRDPRHPYTKALISAVLDVVPGAQSKRIILQGDIPSPIDPPRGCRFSGRCPQALAECATTKPPLVEVGKNHFAACINMD
ncbi:MAG TPA: oligopeptide/dipeptide ABC transporter ATP-binding protein [Clostridia bacterium]|nr:oligopeptide/dipeptide ABC transporter ATP-binding protein [Clostridia bacterium]